MNNLGITVKLVGSPRMARFASFLTDSERKDILRALGAKFKFLTIQNFGLRGKDRPEPWQPLSKEYAKRVKRPMATLELTGNLFRSLRVGVPTTESIEVSTDNPYAAAHQFGNERLPRRPFFPIDERGNATPVAQRILETTAALELQKQMRRHV